MLKTILKYFSTSLQFQRTAYTYKGVYDSVIIYSFHVRGNALEYKSGFHKIVFLKIKLTALQLTITRHFQFIFKKREKGVQFL